MPELPEVEVVRRGLQATVAGHRVNRMVVRQRQLRWQIPLGLSRRIVGKAIKRIDRRSKYLLLRIGDGTLIVHLGMSGNFRFLPAAQAQPHGPHDHVDLMFDAGVLRYTDPRRFGAMLWHGAKDGPLAQHSLLSHLGVEPLGDAFSGQVLHDGCRGRKQSIKQLLLAGRVVVGVGNIYASESLFRAGIRPGKAAGRLSRPACDRLADAIRQTLSAAIEQGGTTLRDFAGASGQGGYFQLSAKVYGQAGAPCPQCGNTIRRSVHQQRATYWCRTCQQ